MLGFRGHFTTKSRIYSTTYGTLRSARADYIREATGQPHRDDETTLVIAHWVYAGQGFTPGESALATTVIGHHQPRTKEGPR